MGITQKHKRDYIVTFPSKEDIQYYSRKTKKYVAVPWDCRIPRIQIHRTQAEKYQVKDTAPWLPCFCRGQLLDQCQKALLIPLQINCGWHLAFQGAVKS